MAENNLGSTQYFRTKPDQELEVKEILDLVYNAMEEKGYNPVNQIVGYIMSGDPTYITSHKGARSMIMKVERDELVEELRILRTDPGNTDYESDGIRLWFQDCRSCHK